VDGQPVDPVRGPWPLLAGTAGKPVELTVLTPGARPPGTPPILGENLPPQTPPTPPTSGAFSASACLAT
jgi:hypothetical protein